MRYSAQPTDGIFVKGYGFLFFAKNIGKNFGKNISKNLSLKYRTVMLAMHQKLLGHTKQSATDAFKIASKRVIQKTTETTADLIGNEIANKIMKVSKN